MHDSTKQNSLVVDQFTQQASEYAQLTSSLASARTQAWVRLLEPCAEDLALDVCCGPGTLALELAPHVAHVTGMDLTPAMLEQARMRQVQHNIGNVDWTIGDITDIPRPDSCFSIVTCSAALHHLMNPRAAFAEMARVCRPGGRILVKDVTPEASAVAAYDEFEKLRDPSHVHALTVEELRSLAEGLPLDELSLTTTMTSPLSLEAILATSFPESCSRRDLYSMLHDDALSGANRWGFNAVLVNDEVCVSYRMSTAVWRKR